MASLFFVGGFPQGTSQQELKEHIQNDLDVKNMKILWFDPRHVRRAVFLCSEDLDIKKIDDLLKMKPLNEKTLFGGQEDETELLFVEVPSMKCKALIDKLPWLFHQRKNGGSKVTDIEEMKENNFKLTFQDGWDAVLRVIGSDWYIGETKVQVTPFFRSFQEDYKTQKQRYKPKELTHQVQENPMVPTKPRNYKTEQIGGQESATAIPATSPHKSDDHFHNSDKSAMLSESPNENALQIVKQNKPSAPSESPGESAAQNIKEIKSESLSESLGERAALIVKDTKSTLPSESPQKSYTVLQKKSTKNATRQFFPSSNAILVLLDCLSFTKIVNEKYPDVIMTIDMEDNNISLRGPALLLKTLIELIHDQDVCLQKDVFSMFLCSTNHEHLKQYFHDHHTTAVLEDNADDGGLKILVSCFPKKMSLLDYLSSKISLVQTWPSVESEKIKYLRNYASKFNDEHFDYKLDFGIQYLNLFRFGMAFDDSKVICEIQSTVEHEPNLKQNLLNASTDKSAEKQLNETQKMPVPSANKKPGLMPKPIMAGNVGLQPSLIDLLSCLSLEDRIIDSCQQMKVEMNKEDGLIKLKGMTVEVKKIKHMLLSMNTTYDLMSTNNYGTDFQQIFASPEYQKLYKRHFKLLLETEKDEFVVYIQDNSDKKGTFKDFTTKVLKLVDCSHDIPLETTKHKEFQQKFNSHHQSFQLIEIDRRWWLMKLSYDDDDQVVTKYKDTLFSNGKTQSMSDSDSNATQRHQTLQSEQSRTYIFMQPKVEKFLENASRCNAMRKDLKKKVFNVAIEGSELHYDFNVKDRADAANALQSYFSKIQEKKICLDHPGVKEFFESNEGRLFFAKIGDKHAYVVTTPYESTKALPVGNKIEGNYKVTLLGTFTQNNVYFHVTQGDGRNVKVEGHIYIRLPRTGKPCRGNIQGNKMTIDLPNWSFKDGGKEGEESLRDLLKPAYEEVMSKDWKHIAVSVNSGCIGRFPCQILSRTIIEEACKTFGGTQKTMNVFLCETESVPLLEAFQYALTGSTDFTQPSEMSLRKISNQVLYNKEPDHYTDKMKFSVSTSWHVADVNKNPAKKTLICFPIQTPLEASPLKEALHSKYDSVIKSVEECRPDGLLVGEVFPLSDVSLFGSSDVALYGCQKWDIGVKKALQETLNNCLDVVCQYNNLHIVVPGAKQPFIYPQGWLVSKWFEYLDNWMSSADQHNKYPKHIRFVVEDQQWKRLFDEHLKRREKTFWCKPPQGKKSASLVEFLILSRESSHQRVLESLKTELKTLMEKNRKIRRLSTDHHHKFEKSFATDNPKIKLSSKKSGSRSKAQFEWTISGLTDHSVDDALKNLTDLIGFDRNGSSVDHQYLGTCSTSSQPGGNDATENASDGDENDTTENECLGEGSENDNVESELVLEEGNRNGSSSRQTTEIGIKHDEVPNDCLPSVEDFQWHYHVGEKTLVFYDEDSTKLEKAYRNDYSCDMKTMKVDFSTMLATSKDKDLKRFAISRSELIKYKPLPLTWTEVGLTKLSRKDLKDKPIDSEICDDFEIDSIHRIENADLYSKYCGKKKHMGNQYEEKVMWQIVNVDFKNQIVKHGCQKSFLTLRCDELGDGICFASHTEKCYNMIQRDTTKNNKYTLVRCYVYLGAEGKGERGLRFPPMNFSSVSNKDYSMVFSSIQAYPTHFVDVQLWVDSES